MSTFKTAIIATAIFGFAASPASAFVFTAGTSGSSTLVERMAPATGPMARAAQAGETVFTAGRETSRVQEPALMVETTGTIGGQSRVPMAERARFGETVFTEGTGG